MPRCVTPQFVMFPKLLDKQVERFTCCSPPLSVCTQLQSRPLRILPFSVRAAVANAAAAAGAAAAADEVGPQDPAGPGQMQPFPFLRPSTGTTTEDGRHIREENPTIDLTRMGNEHAWDELPVHHVNYHCRRMSPLWLGCTIGGPTRVGRVTLFRDWAHRLGPCRIRPATSTSRTRVDDLVRLSAWHSASANPTARLVVPLFPLIAGSNRLESTEYSPSEALAWSSLFRLTNPPPSLLSFD